ncbi:MAG: YesL family protein [Lawsonibacter sp.]|nr:YesL family protein [Lawsonibacter sp.]
MFQPNSFLIRFLTKVCDLLFLNIMFVLSCATVVFSGAAVTSLYAMMLKMMRGRDCAPLKDFLRALRENFLPSFPATLLLFVDVTLLALLHTALYAETLLMPPALFILLTVIAVFLTALLSWLFPLLARFENTFPNHLSNAARLAVANLPVTFFLTAVNLLPLLLRVLIPASLGVVFAFWMLFGFAAGAWANAFYLNRIFETLQGG